MGLCITNDSMNVYTIEIRLECRCLQKCFLIWNYYVGWLWAPLLVLTQSKETIFWSNLVFFTIKTRFWQLNMRNSHFNYEFLVSLGPIISRFFCIFKWGKKLTKTAKGACSSPISKGYTHNLDPKNVSKTFWKFTNQY